MATPSAFVHTSCIHRCACPSPITPHSPNYLDSDSPHKDFTLPAAKDAYCWGSQGQNRSAVQHHPLAIGVDPATEQPAEYPGHYSTGHQVMVLHLQMDSRDAFGGHQVPACMHFPHSNGVIQPDNVLSCSRTNHSQNCLHVLRLPAYIVHPCFFQHGFQRTRQRTQT
jgi:hypothetical protein